MKFIHLLLTETVDVYILKRESGFFSFNIINNNYAGMYKGPCYFILAENHTFVSTYGFDKYIFLKRKVASSVLLSLTIRIYIHKYHIWNNSKYRVAADWFRLKLHKGLSAKNVTKLLAFLLPELSLFSTSNPSSAGKFGKGTKLKLHEPNDLAMFTNILKFGVTSVAAKFRNVADNPRHIALKSRNEA